MAQLGFSIEFPQRLHYLQKETFFQEKILKTLINNKVKIDEKYLKSEFLKPLLIPQMRAKLHTFRKIGGRNLKPGSKLHPTVNSRTKNSFQFAPVMTLVSKEVVEIRREVLSPGKEKIFITIGGYNFKPVVIVGGEITTIEEEVKQMIYNDGFDTPKVFFSWFKASGIYECLHWTNLKYGEDVSDS